MVKYSDFEYICIDVANQMGHDKLLFEERIQWVKDNFNDLETLRDDWWKEKPQYLKAVQVLRKICRGESTGHMVGLDAVCSGMQLSAALTGCEKGAASTGLIDPNRRADAYTECLNIMRKYVPALPNTARKDVKQALMTANYGSLNKPKEIFGNDTPELTAFKLAQHELSPGTVELLEVLRNSWRSDALCHSWVLPDNHHVHVKVMQQQTTRIEVDELDHSTFTYTYEENIPRKQGLSNIANVVHSVDAYLLRSIVRRCNYNPVVVEKIRNYIAEELLVRNINKLCNKREILKPAVKIAVERYEATKMVDVSVLDHLDYEDLRWFSTEYLEKLANVLAQMQSSKSFPVITVHDEFKCHAGNVNQLRFHYKEVMAEIAESTMLADILTHILGQITSVQKLSNNLGQLIRKSNYGLC